MKNYNNNYIIEHLNSPAVIPTTYTITILNLYFKDDLNNYVTILSGTFTIDPITYTITSFYDDTNPSVNILMDPGTTMYSKKDPTQDHANHSNNYYSFFATTKKSLNIPNNNHVGIKNIPYVYNTFAKLDYNESSGIAMFYYSSSPIPGYNGLRFRYYNKDNILMTLDCVAKITPLTILLQTPTLILDTFTIKINDSDNKNTIFTGIFKVDPTTYIIKGFYDDTNPSVNILMRPRTTYYGSVKNINNKKQESEQDNNYINLQTNSNKYVGISNIPYLNNLYNSKNTPIIQSAGVVIGMLLPGMLLSDNINSSPNVLLGFATINGLENYYGYMTIAPFSSLNSLSVFPPTYAITILDELNKDESNNYVTMLSGTFTMDPITYIIKSFYDDTNPSVNILMDPGKTPTFYSINNRTKIHTNNYYSFFYTPQAIQLARDNHIGITDIPYISNNLLKLNYDNITGIAISSLNLGTVVPEYTGISFNFYDSNNELFSVNGLVKITPVTLPLQTPTLILNTYRIKINDSNNINTIFTGIFKVDPTTNIIKSFYDDTNPNVNILMRPRTTFFGSGLGGKSNQDNNYNNLQTYEIMKSVGIANIPYLIKLYSPDDGSAPPIQIIPSGGFDLGILPPNDDNTVSSPNVQIGFGLRNNDGYYRESYNGYMTITPFTSSPLTPSPLTQDTIIINAAKNELLNSIAQFNTPTSTNTDKNTVLDSLENITIDQSVSVIVPLPNNIAKIFTDNPITYPALVGEKLPVQLATTVTNTDTGNEVLDVTQITNNSIVVIPSLVAGSVIEIGNITIMRGTKTSGRVGLTKQISIDNGLSWLDIGSPIIVGNKIFKLSGIGSPVVFTITSNTQPQTILDYLFMYSYIISFIGCIIYGFTTSLNLNMINVIANKNILIVINMYILICGIISFCTWYDIELPYNLFNQHVVLITN